MSDDAQARQDEIEALQAIFDQDFKLKDKEVFEVSVEVDEDRVLSLHAALPESYPSEAPPIFEFEAQWLTASDQEILTGGLNSLWVEGKGEVIIFNWIDWLRTEASALISPPDPKPVELEEPPLDTCQLEEEQVAFYDSDEDAGFLEQAQALAQIQAQELGGAGAGLMSVETLSKWSNPKIQKT